jgi:hypothetical protein
VIEEGTKLDALVAHDIRAWRATGSEFVEGVGDDGVEIFLLQRDDVERDIELLTAGSDVAEIFLPRALAESGHLIFEPDLEIKGAEIVTFLSQESQSDRAVDASRQEHGDFHAATFIVVNDHDKAYI